MAEWPRGGLQIPAPPRKINRFTENPCQDASRTLGEHDNPSRSDNPTKKRAVRCSAAAAQTKATTGLDPSQWKSTRATNVIEQLNEDFRRRIRTRTVPPCAETAPMLLRALRASGQISLLKVDGWEALSQPIEPSALDRAA